MRKLYNEFFYIPKHGKIREKVMLTRVAMTIVIMVMCLVSMSLTAYAYFSYNVTSGSNTIKAANFETNVQVQITDENGAAVKVETSNDNKSRVAELEANTKYYITLQHTDRSTVKTGFVIITAEKCNSRYHTQQLGKDGNGNTETITFWLQPNADTKVTFVSHWGTSSYYGYGTENDELYILNGDEVTLSIDGAANANLLEDNIDSTGEEAETASTTESSMTTSTENTATDSDEPSSTAESTTQSTESAATEPTDTTASTEIQSATEPTDTTASTENQSAAEPAETTGTSITETSE